MGGERNMSEQHRGSKRMHSGGNKGIGAEGRLEERLLEDERGMKDEGKIRGSNAAEQREEGKRGSMTGSTSI